jgi:hypothetical protein
MYSRLLAGLRLAVHPDSDAKASKRRSLKNHGLGCDSRTHGPRAGYRPGFTRLKTAVPPLGNASAPDPDGYVLSNQARAGGGDDQADARRQLAFERPEAKESSRAGGPGGPALWTPAPPAPDGHVRAGGRLDREPRDAGAGIELRIVVHGLGERLK